jgi:hypothetical protein
LPEPAGPESSRIGSSVAQGEEKTKNSAADVTNIEQFRLGVPYIIESGKCHRTGRSGVSLTDMGVIPLLCSSG